MNIWLDERLWYFFWEQLHLLLLSVACNVDQTILKCAALITIKLIYHDTFFGMGYTFACWDQLRCTKCAWPRRAKVIQVHSPVPVFVRSRQLKLNHVGLLGRGGPLKFFVRSKWLKFNRLDLTWPRSAKAIQVKLLVPVFFVRLRWLELNYLSLLGRGGPWWFKLNRMDLCFLSSQGNSSLISRTCVFVRSRWLKLNHIDLLGRGRHSDWFKLIENEMHVKIN